MDYEKYTKRFSETKQVQWKLIPQGRTEETIREKEYLEYDKEIDNRIKELYPVVDSWALSLVTKGLERFEFPFGEYDEAIKKEAEAKKKAAELDTLDDSEENSEEAASVTAKEYEKALKEQIVHAVASCLPEILQNKDKTFSKMLAAPLIKDILPEYVKTCTDMSFNHTDAYLNLQALRKGASYITSYFRTRQTELETKIPDREVENFLIYRNNMPIISALLAENAPKEIKEFFEKYPESRSFATPDTFALIMTQEGVEGYNRMLNGVVGEAGIIEKGLKMLINEFNAQMKQDKGYKGPFYKQPDELKKIPLAPVEKQYQFRPLENDDDVREILERTSKDGAAQRKKVLSLLKDREAEGIYIDGNNLHSLSHMLYGEHDKIPQYMQDIYVEKIKKKYEGKRLPKKAQKQIDNASKNVRSSSYPVAEIEKITGEGTLKVLSKNLTSLHLALSAEEESLVFDGKIKRNRRAQDKIQHYCDLYKDFSDMAKIILSRADDGDPVFYNEYRAITKALTDNVRAQNRIGSYITKKPKDEKASRMAYFGTISRRDNGWWHLEQDSSNEFTVRDFSFLQKDGKYYYLILADDAVKFIPQIVDKEEDHYLMRSQNKGAKGAMTDLPNSIFCRKPGDAKAFFRNHPEADHLTLTEGFNKPFTITREQYEIYMKGLHKKGAGTVEDARKYMELLRDFVLSAESYACYDYSNLGDVSEYDTANEFAEDIDKLTLSMRDVPVSAAQIDGLVEEGKALLFLITTEDLYTAKTRKKNYSRILIEAMAEENMKRLDVMFCSKAWVDHRDVVIQKKDRIIHRNGSYMINRRDVNGDPIPEDIKEELYKFKNGMLSKLSDKAMEYLKKGQCVYKQVDTEGEGIIKDKRYTQEQYTLHIAYVINRKCAKRTQNGYAPDNINKRMQEEDNNVVVSISRSARDLLYYVVYDGEKVLEEGSLNKLDGYDYMAKIRGISRDRREEKKLWRNETMVKDIKDGYCRRAITEIVKIAMKHGATAILCESISDNFKDKYSCIDNQMFKGFEKKLNARLSAIHSKDVGVYEPGGLFNQIQLADNSGNKYQDGILKYISGAFIRGMDLDTGFYSLFKKGEIHTLIQKKEFFGLFDSITVTPSEIEFAFDYSKFDVSRETNKTKWTIKIAGPVSEYDRENKCYKTVDNPAGLIYEQIPNANGEVLLTKDMVMELPGKVIDMLWKYFKIILSGKFIEKNGSEYLVSPVTGKRVYASSNAAILLAKKNAVMKEYDNKAPQKSKKTGDGKEDRDVYWLNRMQEGA